ncbi:MAG: flagellar biosynthesis protein FliQ [Phycisphaeraceae bacterium]|jgi:flagellar biosynthetic protein FliQ|nr:flagellar biosynthesis protein FliQ [Phycisphaeraceae bacterium]
MLQDQAMLEAVRSALLITMKIALPILAAGLVIGLIVSIFQAVTSIQDQTLSFAPKMIVMIGVLILLLPWTVQRMIEFAREMFTLG